MHDVDVDGEDGREQQSAWRGRPDPWDLGRHKDIQHKAQISSITFIIY